MTRSLTVSPAHVERRVIDAIGPDTSAHSCSTLISSPAPAPNSGERCDNVHRLQTKHSPTQALHAKGVAGSVWQSANGVHRHLD